MTERTDGVLSPQELSQIRYDAKLREVGLENPSNTQVREKSQELFRRGTVHDITVGAIIYLGPKPNLKVGLDFVNDLRNKPPFERVNVLDDLERDIRLESFRAQQR